MTILNFPKRARRRRSDVANLRIWEAAGGRYRVVCSRCRFGPRKGRQAIAEVWRAEELIEFGTARMWTIISRHRRDGPAFRACQNAAQEASNSAGLEVPA